MGCLYSVQVYCTVICFWLQVEGGHRSLCFVSAGGSEVVQLANLPGIGSAIRKESDLVKSCNLIALVLNVLEKNADWKRLECGQRPIGKHLGTGASRISAAPPDRKRIFLANGPPCNPSEQVVLCPRQQAQQQEIQHNSTSRELAQHPLNMEAHRSRHV